jgi:uncharacterized protein YcbK (DUF882 family)
MHSPLRRTVAPCLRFVRRGAAVLGFAAMLPAVASAQGGFLSALFGRDAAGGADTTVQGLKGRSGKLRLRILGPSRALAIPIIQRLFGDSAVSTPGLHTSHDTTVDAREVSVATVVPFEEKSGRFVDGYRVGYWPEEKGRLRSTSYVNPDGFVKVTEEMQDLPVSEHFRLRDFITHDQTDVWPKYIVLRDELVDKLELVIADLKEHGVDVSHVKVISGFRHPEYNAALRKGRKRRGPGAPARDSRHQFGDAADIIIDNNDDGRLDDLNGDHKVNKKDIQILQDAVNRVEEAYPELIGGLGTYKATRQHGPFIHIDVRGNRARWGRA